MFEEFRVSAWVSFPGQYRFGWKFNTNNDNPQPPTHPRAHTPCQHSGRPTHSDAARNRVRWGEDVWRGKPHQLICRAPIASFHTTDNMQLPTSQLLYLCLYLSCSVYLFLSLKIILNPAIMCPAAIYLSPSAHIYKVYVSACLSVCLFVCLFVCLQSVSSHATFSLSCSLIFFINDIIIEAFILDTAGHRTLTGMPGFQHN